MNCYADSAGWIMPDILSHKEFWTMAYVITDKCTACGTCVETCPVEAISEGDPIYTIDQETCVDCGQCVDACPAEAIVEE